MKQNSHPLLLPRAPVRCVSLALSPLGYDFRCAVRCDSQWDDASFKARGIPRLFLRSGERVLFFPLPISFTNCPLVPRAQCAVRIGRIPNPSNTSSTLYSTVLLRQIKWENNKAVIFENAYIHTSMYHCSIWWGWVKVWMLEQFNVFIL